MENDPDAHPGFWLNPATGRFLSKSARTYNSIKRTELLNVNNITIVKKEKDKIEAPRQAAPDSVAPAVQGPLADLVPGVDTLPATLPISERPKAAPTATLTRSERVALFWKQNGY